MTEVVLTDAEVAERLQVSRRVVQQELRSGRLHGFKLGGKWRVADAALIDYVELMEYRHQPRTVLHTIFVEPE